MLKENFDGEMLASKQLKEYFYNPDLSRKIHDQNCHEPHTLHTNGSLELIPVSQIAANFDILTIDQILSNF